MDRVQKSKLSLYKKTMEVNGRALEVPLRVLGWTSGTGLPQTFLHYMYRPVGGCARGPGPIYHHKPLSALPEEQRDSPTRRSP
jgi:hypothetical protein